MSKLIKEDNALAVVNPFSANIDSSDIDIPRINIVQKTSDIFGPDGEPAPYGSVVIDKTYIIGAPEEDIRVIPLIASKAWREDIKFDSDEVTRIAWNEEERKDLASDSSYDLLEFAEITLLFKGDPKGDEPEKYPLPIGKDFYAIGKINTAKDAYRQTYKRLYTFAQFNRKTPLHTREWNFKSTLLSRGKYSWYAPMLGVSADNSSDDILEFVEGFLGQ